MSLGESIEDPFHELKDECYICFEVCQNKSPCKCERYVHDKCLADWRQRSDSDHCTECLEKYTIKKRKACCCYVIYLILMYAAGGLLGQFVYEIVKNEPIDVSAPWSFPYFLSASCFVCVCAFVYVCTLRYREIS
jgi:hypothetical protein